MNGTHAKGYRYTTLLVICQHQNKLPKSVMNFTTVRKITLLCLLLHFYFLDFL